MNLDVLVKSIIAINESISKLKKEGAEPKRFNILHSMMVELRDSLTQQQLNMLSNNIKESINDAIKEIFELTSEDYQDKFEAFLSESYEQRKEKSKIKTKTKHTIGFTSDFGIS